MVAKASVHLLPIPWTLPIQAVNGVKTTSGLRAQRAKSVKNTKTYFGSLYTGLDFTDKRHFSDSLVWDVGVTLLITKEGSRISDKHGILTDYLCHWMQHVSCSVGLHFKTRRYRNRKTTGWTGYAENLKLIFFSPCDFRPYLRNKSWHNRWLTSDPQLAAVRVKIIWGRNCYL
jgi:hypothetical protein